MAFYRLDPWDGERLDVAAGIVARTMAEINRDRKNCPKPYPLDDFMFDWTAEPGEEGETRSASSVPSPEELAAKVMAFSAGLKRRAKDKENAKKAKAKKKGKANGS